VSKNPEFAHVTMTIRHDGGKNPRSAPVKFNEKNDGGRKAESAHEDSASREFRSMTRQEAQAKPGQRHGPRRIAKHPELSGPLPQFGHNIHEERRGQKSPICTRGFKHWRIQVNDETGGHSKNLIGAKRTPRRNTKALYFSKNLP